MPPVPVSMAITPSNSFVVAWPSTLGPKMENTVEAAAHTNTVMMAGR